MRYISLVLALLTLLPAQAQKFSLPNRQQDLNYVAAQVPKLHANFFYQFDPASKPSTA